MMGHSEKMRKREDRAVRTRVSIADGKWYLNGQITYPMTSAEGLLMNVRMVNSTFEDLNRSDFDPAANTESFLAQIPAYVAYGVRAFTLNLQGGWPGYRGARNSAFNPDGTLRPSYLERIGRVVDACDRYGAVIILGCYYQAQDQVLTDDEALRRGVAAAAGWVQNSGFGNVLLEIANEFGFEGFDHEMLKRPEGQVELIQIARQAAPGLYVSTSSMAHGWLAESVAEAANFPMIHLNDVPVEEVPTRITPLKRFLKPIVCNEDDKIGEEGARAAALCVGNGASWGLMAKNVNQYYPFTFTGPDDDPTVYAALKQLTTTPS
jgi:hypothetical protein